jgi:sulfite reductase alpha subunit-like flavoprotein
LVQFPADGLSVFELFTYWINLMEPPSRHFMHVLSYFVSDSLHGDKLREFAAKSAEGKSEYYRYAVRERRTVLEVLNDFQQTGFQLPIEYLIQLCGKQKPREFSISSSLSAHPDEAHLTMAVTEYQTPFKRDKKGVCSHWLRGQLDRKSD